MKRSTKVLLAPEIASLINTGDLQSLFFGKYSGRHVKTIDFFSPSASEDQFQNRHIIHLTESKENNVICLFPNHSDPKKHVLDSSSYYFLSSLNKELNARLREPVDSSKIVMAVAYGQHVYVCKLITGTVYLVWAKFINRINAGNVANTPYRNVPLIINCDGHYVVKGIYILRPKVTHENDLLRLPITKGNPLIFQDGVIFVCETESIETRISNKITTITQQEALQICTYQTKDAASTWLPYEENVFKKHNNKTNIITDDGEGDLFDDVSFDLEINNNKLRGKIMLTKESMEHSLGFEEDLIVYEERDPFDDQNREPEKEEEEEKDAIHSSMTEPVLIL